MRLKEFEPSHPDRGRTTAEEERAVWNLHVALFRNDLAFKRARRPIAGASGSAAEIQQARANLRTLAVRRDVDHRLQDLVHEGRALGAKLGGGIADTLHKQAGHVAGDSSR